MKSRIRVLVVDDSAFVRKAVERMLGAAGDIEVVGFAADGEEGLARARELQPDVVTLDIRMPKLGHRGIRSLRHAHGGKNSESLRRRHRPRWIGLLLPR